MENSHIAWTDHTFNPWIGCTKVSPGCLHCYAETRDKRFHGEAIHWGPGAPRQRTSRGYWKQPDRWNKKPGERFTRVFCGSLCDWLDPEIPIRWFADLLDVIRRCDEWVTWQMLTKRPECWTARMEAALEFARTENMSALGIWIEIWLSGISPAHVHFGFTAENQTELDKRAVAAATVPAVVRFISAEPLLGQLVLDHACDDGTGCIDLLRGLSFCDGRNEPVDFPKIDWVIVGGESGPYARPCELGHIYSVVEQCVSTQTPVFVKQLGSNARDGLKQLHLGHPMGADPAEWPGNPLLEFRQFPENAQ